MLKNEQIIIESASHPLIDDVKRLFLNHSPRRNVVRGMISSGKWKCRRADSLSMHI